jgi:hypothetical protein
LGNPTQVDRPRLGGGEVDRRCSSGHRATRRGEVRPVCTFSGLRVSVLRSKALHGSRARARHEEAHHGRRPWSNPRGHGVVVAASSVGTASRGGDVGVSVGTVLVDVVPARQVRYRTSLRTPFLRRPHTKWPTPRAHRRSMTTAVPSRFARRGSSSRKTCRAVFFQGADTGKATEQDG